MTPSAALLAATIVCLHFQLVGVAGFPLTIAPIAAPLLMRNLLHLRVRATGALGVCLMLALVGIVATVSPDVDGVQFLRTLGLVLFSALMVTGTSQGVLYRRVPSWVAPGCFLALGVTGSFTVLQYIAARRGSYALYNPWGSHQYLYQYDYALQLGSIRAPGFYLEPSFNALVLTSLLFMCLMLQYKPILAIALATAGVACTRSLSGLLILLAISAVTLRARRHLTRSGGGLHMLLAFGGVGLVISGFTSYIQTRALSGTVEGTSTNYRLVAPIPILRNVLVHSPLGEPLGAVRQVISSYGLLNGSKAGSSLDNGLYLLVFYFGWAGVLGILVVVGRLLPRAREAPFTGRALLLFTLLTLLNTGGIFLPEFILLSCLVLAVWRSQAAPSDLCRFEPDRCDREQPESRTMMLRPLGSRGASLGGS